MYDEQSHVILSQHKINGGIPHIESGPQTNLYYRILFLMLILG